MDWIPNVLILAHNLILSPRRVKLQLCVEPYRGILSRGGGVPLGFLKLKENEEQKNIEKESGKEGKNGEKKINSDSWDIFE